MTISAVQRRRDPKTHRPPDVVHTTWRKDKDIGTQDFACLDGEGVTLNGSSHKYVLLGVGSDQKANRMGLGWDEILEFLYSHYRKGTAFTGFFLGYDFTQWFRNLPEERARMLLTIEGRAKRQRRVKGGHNIAPHPVEWRDWQFDILGTKRLRIRPKNCDCAIQSCPCKPKPPWMYICDSGGFFQTSLVNVIDPSKWQEPIVTPEEFEKILAGKAKRATASLDQSMLDYNALENEILRRALKELDKGFRTMGIHLTPSQWYGPGQAAQEWLKARTEAPTRVEIQALAETWPSGLLEAAMASYFGGWFELFMHGLIKGQIHEYDINSAYPYIISQLPCLLHGTWESGIGKPDVASGQICLVYARVQSCSLKSRKKRWAKQYIGAMLHRDKKGRITRPKVTEGWYWHHEIKAARKAKCLNSIIYNELSRWYKYIPCDCPPPIREVANLYKLRLTFGKDSAIGKSAKLVANSCYGKFAQSVGKPLFGNPIYASLITAGCRVMILEAIATHPKGKADVAMVATDAVYFLSEHSTIRISNNLGEWSHKRKSNMCLFKPGVYWDDEARNAIATGRNPIFKARGVNARAFASELEGIDQWFREWNGRSPHCGPNDPLFDEERSATWPTITYRPGFTMTTALQALIQNKWDQAGELINYDEHDLPVQNSNPIAKRSPRVYYNEDGIYRSEPWDHGYRGNKVGEIVSVPYDKKFGLEDPFSDETAAMSGETPDGPIGDIFAEALGIR